MPNSTNATRRPIGPIHDFQPHSQSPTQHKGHAIPQHIQAMSLLYDSELNPNQAHFTCEFCHLTYREEHLQPPTDQFSLSSQSLAHRLACRYCAKAGYNPSWLVDSVAKQQAAKDAAKDARRQAHKQLSTLSPEEHTLTEQQTGHTAATQSLHFGKPSDYTKGTK